MNIGEFFLWCAVMLPLIFSPGPANISTASLAASQGFRGALPYTLGIGLINCLVTGVVGLGMGLIYAEYRQAFQVLECAGALYIVYLGYRILSAPPKSCAEGQRALGFRDGVIFQCFNSKLFPMLIMMFSQFIDGDRSTGWEVFELSALLVVVSHLSYILWACLGAAIGRYKSERADRLQRYGFGGLLTVVGLWLFVHALIT